jgi:hypothetical protein
VGFLIQKEVTGMGGILVGFLALLVYVSMIGFALFVAYHLISASITMKNNSKQQTELLREIKGLLEKIVDRADVGPTARKENHRDSDVGSPTAGKEEDDVI